MNKIKKWSYNVYLWIMNVLMGREISLLQVWCFMAFLYFLATNDYALSALSLVGGIVSDLVYMLFIKDKNYE